MFNGGGEFLNFCLGVWSPIPIAKILSCGCIDSDRLIIAVLRCKEEEKSKTSHVDDDIR